jgi:insertion element IS1 protein InsB
MKKAKGQLTLELDEMWSFVKNKGNKQWIWIALDQKTREIVRLYIGDRSKKSASELWQSLPPVYRQCAVCYTDFWESYSEVLPFKRHRPVGKESGKTSHIERLNNTLPQPIACAILGQFLTLYITIILASENDIITVHDYPKT